MASRRPPARSALLASGPVPSRRRARALRRRRLIMLGCLLGVAALAAVVVLATRSSGGRSGSVRPVAATRGLAHHTRPSHLVVALHPRRRRRGDAAVPILMYHVIASPRPDAPFPGLYVPPSEFRAQMEALARAGYQAVTLDEVRRSWLEGTALPRKPVVITFDNGYRTQYTQALPVLRRLHWVADENLQLSGLPPSQGGLSMREVRALVAAGWELDTQGYSHADLTALDSAALRYQVGIARATLRHRYHVNADWFCYPSGLYDPAVIAAVKAAGFVGSTTVVAGWARRSDDPYRLPRLRVLGGTSAAALLEQLRENRDDAPASSSYLPGADT